MNRTRYAITVPGVKPPVWYCILPDPCSCAPQPNAGAPCPECGGLPAAHSHASPEGRTRIACADLMAGVDGAEALASAAAAAEVDAALDPQTAPEAARLATMERASRPRRAAIEGWIAAILNGAHTETAAPEAE